jgi:hypothetical protein
VTWVPLAPSAPRSVRLLFNEAEFALRLRVWIVECLPTPVSRRFADG